MASITSKRSDQIIRLWGPPCGDPKDAPAPAAKEIVSRNEQRQPRKSRLTIFDPRRTNYATQEEI